MSAALQFACVRAALGAYLAAQLVHWLPHAELLHQARELLPLRTGFPSVLRLASDATALRALLLGFTALALAYAAGLWRVPLAIALWYVWACLVERTILVAVPSDGYVGWLLLATAAVPRTDVPPRELVTLSWLVLGASYLASGLDKWTSPSWRAGDALGIALTIPVAREWSPDLVSALPPIVLRLATWSALALECGCGVLCMVRAARPWIWLASMTMHLAVLALLRLESVSIAMLIFHAFQLEPEWLRIARRRMPAALPLLRAELGVR